MQPGLGQIERPCLALANASRHDRRGALLASGLLTFVLAGLGAAYMATLAPSITWANDGADSGDLVTAAAVGGVAHPTGYPTFLLMARAFQLLPFGDLALRTNLLAVCAALAAVAIVFLVVMELCAEHGLYAPVAGALGALALGLAPVFWSQAVIAEVYSLNTLFAATLCLFALRELRPRAASPPPTHARGLIAGLALGNHVTIALLVLGWLVAVAAGAPRGARVRSVAARLPWIGLGLLVYLYLPLCSAMQPPINWGGADTLAGFWWTLSGTPYRRLAFGLSVELLPERMVAWAALLIAQFGVIGVALGLGGLVYSDGARRRLLYGSAVVALSFSFFAMSYDTVDSYAYLLPAYVIFAVWLGCGSGALMAALDRSRFRRLAPVAAVICAALLVAPAPATAARVNASDDTRALAFARAALESAPPGAIVVAEGDRDSFALWYAHYGLEQRPDVAVVVGPLLDEPWYRATMRATYPRITIPDTPPPDWSVVLAEVNAAPVCVTQLDGVKPLSCLSVRRSLDTPPVLQPFRAGASTSRPCESLITSDESLISAGESEISTSASVISAGESEICTSEPEISTSESEICTGESVISTAHSTIRCAGLVRGTRVQLSGLRRSPLSLCAS